MSNDTAQWVDDDNLSSVLTRGDVDWATVWFSYDCGGGWWYSAEPIDIHWSRDQYATREEAKSAARKAYEEHFTEMQQLMAVEW